MDIFLQTSANITNNTAFITEMYDFCSELERFYFVTEVASMVRTDSSLNLTDYIQIYADPYSSENYNYSSLALSPFYYSDLNHIARVSFGSTVGPSDKTLGQSVRSVRHLLSRSFKNSDGSSMLVRSGVTGTAAVQYDTLADLRDTLPKFIAVLVIFMFFFVLLLTGSVILPFKSVLSSGLSITSSFAFVMFVFQNGNGSNFLHFRNNFRCLDPTQLLFIFVVAFGLSLDYEVFILGRIQEVYMRTGDNNYAIAKGVSSSARSVTVAAILICTAVCGFLASSSIILKMIGMGIGLTIVMDATLIRCVFIPALMSILGPVTWWAPERVKTIVAYVGIQEAKQI
jgi:uncharacterized membrane protein YdfJ with MMPL/SSD domain